MGGTDWCCCPKGEVLKIRPMGGGYVDAGRFMLGFAAGVGIAGTCCGRQKPATTMQCAVLLGFVFGALGFFCSMIEHPGSSECLLKESVPHPVRTSLNILD